MTIIYKRLVMAVVGMAWMIMFMFAIFAGLKDLFMVLLIIMGLVFIGAALFIMIWLMKDWVCEEL